MSSTNENGKKRSLKLPLLLIVAGLASFAYLLFFVSQEIDFQKAGSQVLQVVRRDSEKTALDETNQDSAEGTDLADSGIIDIYSFTADETGQTPFSLLLNAVEVEYDEYDFGVFVQSIDGQTNDNDYFWALYVNGEFAQEASDKIELEAGDEVEWRWEEVQSDLFN